MKLVLTDADFRHELTDLEWTELTSRVQHLGVSAPGGTTAVFRLLPRVLESIVRKSIPRGMRLHEFELSCELEVSVLGNGVTGTVTLTFVADAVVAG
jgi:hypothetical protein